MLVRKPARKTLDGAVRYQLFLDAFHESELSPAQLARRINKLLNGDEPTTSDIADYQVLYHLTEHIGSYFVVERSEMARRLPASPGLSRREENSLLRTPGAHNTCETAQDARDGVLPPQDAQDHAPRTLTYQCPLNEPDGYDPCYFVYQADTPTVPEVQTLVCVRHEARAVLKG